MNDLVKVTNENSKLTVLGRDLHKFLEIETPYTIWVKRMLEYGFIENHDFVTIMLESTGGRPSENHQITLDMAKEISMIQRSPKGKEARQYFLECEKKLKGNLFALPGSLKEAYLMLAKQEEEKEKLALERDTAIETKAYISDKKTATAMNTASQLRKENNKLREELGFNKEFATIKRMEIHLKRKFNWVKLKKYSTDNEIEMKYVSDINYGQVRAYNHEAWLACYSINLDEIFD